jgi:hypothetical protein
LEANTKLVTSGLDNQLVLERLLVGMLSRRTKPGQTATSRRRAA